MRTPITATYEQLLVTYKFKIVTENEDEKPFTTYVDITFEDGKFLHVNYDFGTKNSYKRFMWNILEFINNLIVRIEREGIPASEVTTYVTSFGVEKESTCPESK